MLQYPYLIYGYVLGLSFVLAVALTFVMRRLALRWNVLDHPGERKMHSSPMPLMGGVAIVVIFYVVILTHWVCFWSLGLGGPALSEKLLFFLGDGGKVKLAGILAGGLLIFLLGVVDDLMSLTPWVKLLGQIAAATVLVASGMRIEAFILSNIVVSSVVTIFWVVLLTNSLNFLDNMDGLCGGVAIFAAISFFLCVQPEDYLVRLLLMIFIGAVGGFLYHNMSPARIFMGDAGAMFIGYLLATVAVMGTFYIQGTSSHIAIAAPLLALSVPLFDTVTVIFIRWRSGQSIMKGDKRHFSHRLVDLGMTPRQAVEFIFLVAGVVGLGGALLPHVGRNGTLIILAQTAGVFLLIVLLMKAGRRSREAIVREQEEQKQEQ
jgi:UDP-GlcNAc:undecaprenyl-phosphate GlcNAc-1-phosphate transferase